MSLNRCIIMGRLARDPELRHTQSGTPVASFTLAVDRDFKDKNTGERATDWIDVVAWRGTGEFVSRYLAKGRLAVVDGRLQIREWTDKEGNKRRSAEVVADNVYFGDSKREEANRTQNWDNVDKDYANDPWRKQHENDQFSDFTDDGGDLPF